MKVLKTGGLVCLALAFLGSTAEAKLYPWKVVGGNKSGLGVAEVRNLRVPPQIKAEWCLAIGLDAPDLPYAPKNAKDQLSELGRVERYPEAETRGFITHLAHSQAIDSVSIPNGGYLEQLSFGLRDDGTVRDIKDSVVCAWINIPDQKLWAVAYLVWQTDSLRVDSGWVVSKTTWTLLHFKACNNIGWSKTARETFFVYVAPPPPPPVIVPKPAISTFIEPPVFTPQIKECLRWEMEFYNSTGIVGNYPYLQIPGGRVIWYPVCSRILSLSAKAFNSGQASYDPSGHPGDFSYRGMNRTYGYKLGLRLEPIPLHIFYFNAGKSWYDGRKNDGLDTELEAIIIRGKWKLGLIFFKLTEDPQNNFYGYFWDRARLERLMWHKAGGDIYLGAEFFHEGGGKTFEPDYSYRRAGALIEYFRPWGRDNWLSLIGEAGYGYFGGYVGVEFCLGFQFYKRTEIKN
ncbi:MAG: hypothetical protein Q8P32_01860 [Candidatus Komeilibacteria bacterium]|nr:hypothetical protein [Candidatus Komeilibacteria bacterium]